MFYLMMHSTHFIYCYIVSDIWLRTTHIERGNLLLQHRLLFPISSKGYLYAPSHRQDNADHSLCYTSHGALAGMRNNFHTIESGANQLLDPLIYFHVVGMPEPSVDMGT